jgi:hypothetical protein
LPDDAAVRHGYLAGKKLAFEQCDRFSLGALDGDERSGVQDERQWVPPRTTTAR